MNRFLIIFLLLLLPLGLWGCKRSGDISRPENIAPWKDSDSKGIGSVSEEGQLMGFAESQEDAEALAELYGITLVEYQNGLALFHTDEDPKEVIRRGQEKGWQELSLNRVQKLPEAP